MATCAPVPARFSQPDGSFIYTSQYLPPRIYGMTLGVWF